MNVLVIGSNGQLGSDMVSVFSRSGHSVCGADFPAVDITSLDSLRRLFSSSPLDLIINCSAFTAVDLCETEPEKAFAVNAQGVGNIGTAAAEIHARVVHISTDYVFAGTGSSPLIETDACEPQSVYGKTKLVGEHLLAAALPAHYIFRIAWLYGANGQNFVKTMRRIALARSADGGILKVVNDQFGTPTWTVDVCRQIERVVATENYGIFHCTSRGSCSWFDFTRRIVDRLGIAVNLVPCTTAEFPRPAPRPAYSVLDNHRLRALGLECMPPWEESFDAFLASIADKDIWN